MPDVAPLRAPSQSAVVLPLSASTTASLEARVADFAQFDYGTTDILDLAHTLASRRSQLPMRGFLVASRSEDIANSFLTGNFVTASKPVSTKASAPFAFVFTGQGSQWPGMCRELFADFPVFQNAIAEMDMVLKVLPLAPDWSLRDTILGDDSTRIHLPQHSQPCCTAIQVALIQLLSSWGVVAAATVGHSSGEIAAAFAAGHLSSAEAIAIAYYRGYCVSKATRDDGAMMAVGLSEEDTSKTISDAGLNGQVRVACVNSPGAVTVSGDTPAVETLAKILQDNGTFSRLLKTGGQAYHSHHMLSVGEDYQALLEQFLPRLDVASLQPQGPSFMSSVTGQVKQSGFSPSYWRQNLEGQVKFAHAIDRMYQVAGPYCFIELGPHSTLELPIRQTLATAGVPETEVQYAAPVKRNTNAVQSVLNFAGNLWLKGYDVNWSRVHGLQGAAKTPCRVLTDLPKYRFTYGEPLWHETRASIEFRKRKYPRHELLGSLMPGGNGRDLIYRNVLRLEDVPWLEDHRLGETVVFPGAGYLAMAMEGVMRATDTPLTAGPVFEFSNVTITNALVLESESATPTELFTSVHKSAITNAATSTTWWEFAISTYRDGSTIQHSAGSIAIRDSETETAPLSSLYPARTSSTSLEATARRTWYERFVKQGLNYGPAFQTISDFNTPRMKLGSCASANAPLHTTYGDPLAVYPIHPITLDGMIQLAVVAAANGRPKELIAQVPTRLVSAVVHTSKASLDQTCQMHAAVERTGFGYIQAGLELSNEAGETLAQIDQIRLAPYHSQKQGETEDTRHPVIRVLWKPDIYGLGLIEAGSAQRYLQGFAEEAHSPVSDDGFLKMGAMLDLLAHKDPDLRILEVGNDSHELTTAVLELLSFQSEFRRLRNYTTAVYTSEDTLVGGPVDFETGLRLDTPTALGDEKFDLILIPGLDEQTAPNVDMLTNALAAHGSILALGPNSASDSLASSALSTLQISLSTSASTLLFSCVLSDPAPRQKPKFLIVERDAKTPLGSALADALRPLQGHWVMRVPLHQLTLEHISSGATVFSLCELESPLLASISDDDMARVKILTDNAASLVWVTGGNIIHGGNPDFGLVSGLSRAVMLEQPSLKFYTYDVDALGRHDNVHFTAQRLVSVLSQQGKVPDFEFAQQSGTVHVSRFTPDDGLNTIFRHKQGLQAMPSRLADASDVRLALKQVGQLDSIYFQEQEAPLALAPTDVRVKVASVGLNAKDYYVLVGQVDTPNASCQVDFAGNVVEIGSAVTEFNVGDRVVSMAPSHFQSYRTVPEWTCHRLLDTESFDVCATLPVVFATAIYGLQYRANFKAGESILIHSGAGGVGIAAIQLALNAGAGEVRFILPIYS